MHETLVFVVRNAYIAMSLWVILGHRSPFKFATQVATQDVNLSAGEVSIKWPKFNQAAVGSKWRDMMNFTDRYIKSLSPKSDRYEVWEGRGFGLRVAPSGRKSWIYLYRFESKPRRMTLGIYDGHGLAKEHLSLAEARLKYTEAVVKVSEKKEDPGKTVQEVKQKEREAETVQQLADVYMERHAKRKKKSWYEDERMLKRDILPRWKNRKAKSITRRDVIELLDEIVDRGAPILANRTLAMVSTMFKFALKRDIVDVSPCYAVDRPEKENRRERHLSEEEIKTFWDNLPKIRMVEPAQLALKLTLILGQRSGEVVSAKWADIDFDKKQWVIPSTITKNKRAHLVPLPDLAIDLFRQAKKLCGYSEYVFPSPKKLHQHLSQNALSQALRFSDDKLGIVPVRPHDLRRTFATMTRGMRVHRPYVGKVLNHTEQGVTSQHYDLHDYLEEKQDVLAAWEQKLLDIIKPQENNIILFSTA
jgi:integrase